MKSLNRIICLVLVLSLFASMGITAFADGNTEQNEAYHDYTNVFVHGLFGYGESDGLNSVVPYWGMTSGDMLSYLKDKGYTAVAASVGPLSSCWDRCCELYAQLTGTVTDYGAAHVDETLKDFNEIGCTLGHERYGRDYTGKALVSEWGPIYDDSGKVTGWYNNKINLIGHSFGGPTIVMLLKLLAQGDANERAYAQAEADANGGDWHDYCSPLFWGDYNGQNLINSLTSLAGVLNGTTFIDSCDDSTELVCSLMVMYANITGVTVGSEFYDFQLEQFGITKSDNPDYDYVLDILRANSFFDGKDNAIYDLSIAGCNELKQGWNCYDDVFYFAYPGCTTSENAITGTQVPNSNTWLLLKPFATFMGAYTNDNEIVTDINGNCFTAIDNNWLPNDGLVNTISASYVFGCPHKDYDGIVEPGKWITMSTYGYDHMDFIGGMADVTQNTRETKAYFDEIMGNIISTYSYSTRLAAPVLTASNVRFSRYVRLSWNEVEGATEYKIYRASSKNGTYKLMTTTKYTGFLDITTLLGKTYYYRITAVNSGNASITSEFSNVEAIKVTF